MKKNYFKTVILFMSVFILTVFSSCSFFSSFSEEESGINESGINISGLTMAKPALTISVGEMSYITVNVKPVDVQKDVKLTWSYDSNIITADTSSAWGVTITGAKEGQTNLKCSYGGYEATCIVTVKGFAENYEETVEPYIYSNTTIIQTSPGVTEKVFCSLYGGTAADIDGYSWTIDNPSVASIEPTGQYCMVTAKDSGYARIKITHSKASYPYYMGIYVFADATNVSYITTTHNILTMNMEDGEKTISVSLVNGNSSSSDSSFSWQIVDEGSSIPVSCEANGNKAVVTPVKAGSCTLRVTHPDAAYPLDILCRVISVVKNVYIEPESTVITLSGDAEQTIKSTLKNIDVGEYNVDAFTYTLDDYNVAEIVGWVGNEVMLKGKANGSCKLLISHEKSAYSREVLVIVNGQLTDTVDASCYITTSQNYIRTKVGAAPTELSISLKGGDVGDETGFIWSVQSTAKEGSNDVIKLETTNGTAIHTRAAAWTYSYGTAYISPIAEGTAIITVSHPKVLYPTEILVKVLSADAILEEPLYFTGSGLIKVLNGESYDYTVELKGKNKVESDNENIRWSTDNNQLVISANGNKAHITAPSLGSGCTTSFITASHSKCDADKKILVMTADDLDSLNSMKALYSDKLYYNIEVGESAICMAEAVGFEGTFDEEGINYTAYDFSKAVWTVKNPSVVSIEKNPEKPLTAFVKGLKSGSTNVTVSLEDVSCDFTITVYPKGTVAIEPEIYFSTNQNVINIKSKGDSVSAYVSAINLSSSEYHNITWISDNEGIASVVPNGTSAAITAKSEGTAIISVTHPESQNTLKIYVRIGSEYVLPEAEPVVYISAQDVLTMLRDDSAQKLQAVLANYTGEDVNGFTFSIDNESVATIYAQNTNGIAFIKPVGSGQAEVTIRHTKTEITKKVLVVVGNSSEELAGFTYLTTSSNVVAVGEGKTKNVSVNIKNAENVVVDGYTWSSSNPSCVDVIESGATAVLKGNQIGTAIITVTNKACQYSLQIIAQCVDQIAAAANPYIQLTSSVMTLPVGNAYTSISAELVGGKESDYSDFVWTTNDSNIAVVYGQNEVGKIRAMNEGTTYITVSHPKAAYSAQLLVVCDKVTESECHISVPSSIITMKPTDSSQTITASLVNGTATDKYNFTWSLDVYDIIDFVYSANVCTITPLQQGQVTITIHHPKSAYDQQIVVTVQEYSTFAFPDEYLTITQGTVSFETMQIPNTKVSTHVEYSTSNSEICKIEGTRTTAQITAIKAGTANVYAKLVANSTGVVQASAEMMVYVKEAPVNACYITAPSTIYTLNKGKSQTLSASITGSGIVTSDQQNLKWSTNDTDIISIAGISSNGTVTGQSIYITANKSGEALITCSHEKAASNLQFYVVVPGTEEKIVTLNKSYITLTKGSSGTALKANIENAESSNDYNDLIWTVSNSGQDEVCRVMGSGQNVTIYPVKAGQAEVMVQLPDSASFAKCTVLVQAGKSFTFESTSTTVQPFGTKKVKYTVSPPDAVLTWTMNQADDFFTYRDLGCDANGVGYVEIDGLKEGKGILYCVTDGGAKGNLSTKVSWNYLFNLDTCMVSGSPDSLHTIQFKVNPSDADIKVIGDNRIFNCTIQKDGVNSGSGVITFEPLVEGSATVIIRATNPNADNAVIGSYEVDLKFIYPKGTVKPAFKKKKNVSYTTGMEAYYSVMENSSLIIGDGEEFTFETLFEQKKLDANITTKFNINSAYKSLITCHDNNDGTYTIAHNQDVTKDAYRINIGYRPTYNGSTSYPDGTPIQPEDFKISTSSSNNGEGWHDGGKECGNPGRRGHRQNYMHVSVNISIVNRKLNSTAFSFSSSRGGGVYCDDCGGWTRDCDSIGNIGQSNLKRSGIWGTVRDASIDGKIIPADDFKKCLWYYLPYISCGEHGCYATLYPQIFSQNINAEYLAETTDTAVVSEVQVGTINMQVAHGGINEPITIPIILRTRNCNCTYKQ